MGKWTCTVTVGISMEIPPKAKHRATYDPDIQLVHPGGPSYMKDSKSAHHRETCISMLIVALLNIAEK